MLDIVAECDRYCRAMSGARNRTFVLSRRPARPRFAKSAAEEYGWRHALLMALCRANERIQRLISLAAR